MSRKHSRRRKKAGTHGRAQLDVPEISALGDPNKPLKKAFLSCFHYEPLHLLELISSKSGQQDSRAQHSTMTTDFITSPKRVHRQRFVCLTSDKKVCSPVVMDAGKVMQLERLLLCAACTILLLQC